MIELSLKSKIFKTIIFWGICYSAAQAQKLPPAYKNSNLPIEQRVADLMKRMSLEEKLAQLQCTINPPELLSISDTSPGNMTSVYGKYLPKEAAEKYNAIQKMYVSKTRLGIPLMMHGEAVFGLMANGMTSFPQPIAQAATWNPELQLQMATAIAKETKSRGHFQVLSSTLNIAYDSRWGRTHETYGEDPYLASRMGVAYIKTMEKNGIATTPKHFAANIGFGGQFGGPIPVTERFLREVEFPAFKAAIMEGKASSIMPAYNTIDGVPCHHNHWLLTKVLRNEWGFKGFVGSDYGALDMTVEHHRVAKDKTDAAAKGLLAGMDLEMPNKNYYGTPLRNALKQNLISMADIDRAVERVLKIKFEKGLFENPFVNPEIANQVCDSKEHRDLAREISRQSMVLLKNNNVLPFKKDIKSIAVLGPLADNHLLGNYAGWGMKKVSILEGIKNKLGASVKVNFEKGVELTQLALPAISPKYLFQPDNISVNGIKAEYFENTELKGNPVLTKIEANIDNDWGEGVPDPRVAANNYSVRWTAKLLAPATGRFKIGMSIDDGARLYLDNKLIIDEWSGGSVRLLETFIEIEKGKTYDLKMEYFEGTYNAVARLGWNAEPANISKALEFAKESDAAIVVVGAIDGEGKDRAILELTPSQVELIKSMNQLKKPYVVILATGNVIASNDWAEETPAILESWYSGEEGGNAVADVLFGDYNPSGKLPITFPKVTGQVPCYYHQLPNIESSYIGIGNEPMFVFGHGLSYTNFEYKNLKFSKTSIDIKDSVEVSFVVKNIGKMKGDEVAQLYIKDIVASVARPVKQLKKFQRITLEPNEEKEVRFIVGKEELAMFNPQMQWEVEPGTFEIQIGSSSKDIRLTDKLQVFQ